MLRCKRFPLPWGQYPDCSVVEVLWHLEMGVRVRVKGLALGAGGCALAGPVVDSGP